MRLAISSGLISIFLLGNGQTVGEKPDSLAENQPATIDELEPLRPGITPPPDMEPQNFDLMTVDKRSLGSDFVGWYSAGGYTCSSPSIRAVLGMESRRAK
jgi:hypothetical protein